MDDVKWLLEQGLDVSILGRPAYSDFGEVLAWRIAYEKGHIDVAKFLINLSLPGELDDIDYEGWKTIRSCIQWGIQIEKISAWIPGLPQLVNRRMKSGLTVFDEACREGHLGFMKWLVEECGADYNLVTADTFATYTKFKREVFQWLVVELKASAICQLVIKGKTWLHWAAKWKSRELIIWLVEVEKMDVNARDWSKRTPLDYYLDNDPNFYQADEYDSDVIDWFVDKWEADLSGKDYDGESTLMRYLPLQFVDLKGVKHWIEDKKADVRDVTASGWTVLHYAVQGGKLDVVKWLVEEKGVDPHARNNSGKTAADFCWGGEEILTWLQGLVDCNGYAIVSPGFTVVHRMSLLENQVVD